MASTFFYISESDYEKYRLENHLSPLIFKSADVVVPNIIKNSSRRASVEINSTVIPIIQRISLKKDSYKRGVSIK